MGNEGVDEDIVGDGDDDGTVCDVSGGLEGHRRGDRCQICDTVNGSLVISNLSKMLKMRFFDQGYRIACQTRTVEAAAYRCGGRVYGEVYDRIADTISGWRMGGDLPRW